MASPAGKTAFTVLSVMPSKCLKMVHVVAPLTPLSHKQHPIPIPVSLILGSVGQINTELPLVTEWLQCVKLSLKPCWCSGHDYEVITIQKMLLLIRQLHHDRVSPSDVAQGQLQTELL